MRQIRLSEKYGVYVCVCVWLLLAFESLTIFMARTNRILLGTIQEEQLESCTSLTMESGHEHRVGSVLMGTASRPGDWFTPHMEGRRSPVTGTLWVDDAGVQCVRSLRVTLGAPAAPCVASSVRFRAGCGWSVVGADLELDFVISDAELVSLESFAERVSMTSFGANKWRVRLHAPLGEPAQPYAESITAEFAELQARRGAGLPQEDQHQTPSGTVAFQGTPHAFDFVVAFFALQPGSDVSERMYLGRAAVLGSELLLRDDHRAADGNRFGFRMKRPIVTALGRVVGEFVFSYMLIEPYQGQHSRAAFNAALEQTRGPGSKPPRFILAHFAATDPTLSGDSAEEAPFPVAAAAEESMLLCTPLIGHRGDGEQTTSLLQENTLLSFLAAIRGKNVRAVELDVQLTRDGVPVVHHDAVLRLPHPQRRLGSTSVTASSGRLVSSQRAPPDMVSASASIPPPDIFGPSGFEADWSAAPNFWEPKSEPLQVGLFPQRASSVSVYPCPSGPEISQDWGGQQLPYLSNALDDNIDHDDDDDDDDDDEDSEKSPSSAACFIRGYGVPRPQHRPRCPQNARPSRCCVARPIFTMDLEEWKRASALLLRRKDLDFPSSLETDRDQGVTTFVHAQRASPTERFQALNRHMDHSSAPWALNTSEFGCDPSRGASVAASLVTLPSESNKSSKVSSQFDGSSAAEASAAPEKAKPTRSGYHLCVHCRQHQSVIRDSMPTLEHVLRKVPAFVHLLVEIKYPLPEGSGREQVPAPERNYLVDRVLDTVFSVAFAPVRRGGADASARLGSRLSFLSFDPEVCLLLRRKQNVCRVFFLCSEDRDGDVVYSDPRRLRAERALEFASQARLSGVVFFNEILLAAGPSLIRLAHHKYRLLVMCYGRSNTVPDCAMQLIEWQVDGIIADRVGYVARALSRSPVPSTPQ